jgi:hypothetical protein
MLDAMHEYLIKAEDGDFLIPRGDSLAETLQPRGYDCGQVPGKGEYRIRCGEVELAFYFEDPGIQVVADTTDDPPDTLVDAVAAQVAAATGRPTSVLRL